MNKHILLVMKYLNDPKAVTQKELDDNYKSSVDSYSVAVADADAAAVAAAYAAVIEYFEITKENKADYEREILKTERDERIEQQSIKELSLALAERDKKIANLTELSNEREEYINSLEEVLRLKELELKELRKEGQVNEK